MPVVNPVILLAKLPVKVPSVVWELVTVGPVVVDQQIPLTVIASPPLEVIVPPDTADVVVTVVTNAVVSVGTLNELVVN